MRGLDPRIPTKCAGGHLSEIAGTSPAMTSNGWRSVAAVASGLRQGRLLANTLRYSVLSG
jgi:hypothetical protein